MSHEAARTRPPTTPKPPLGSTTLRAVVLALMLAAVLGTTLFVVRAVGTPPPTREAKYRNADRQVLYRIRAGSSPSLVLTRGERAVFLVTHAVVRGDAPADRCAPYGLTVRVRQPNGRVLFRQAFWSRSRRSRGRLQGEQWLDENAFTTDGTALSDDRMLEVTMPPGVEDRAVMDFAPAGGTDEVLLRAYRRIRLAPSTAGVRRLALSLPERERLAATRGLPRWEALPERDRNAFVASEWQRLAAVGEEGADYLTRAIFYTGFRRREEATVARGGVPVDPLHAAAWNVLGPATLVFRSDGAPTDVSTLDETGVERSVGHALAAEGSGRLTRVALGEGAYTVFARVAEGEAVASLSSETLDERVYFREGPQPAPVDGERALAPDLRYVPLYEAAAERGDAPLCFAVAGDGALGERALRVEIRRVLRAPSFASAPTDVQYRFVGADDTTLLAGHTSVAAERSEFETLRLGDGTAGLTTEPVALRFVAPPHATSFCVTSAPDAAFRAATLLEGEATLAPPYAEHSSDAVEWRYAPPLQRTWVPLRARGHRALAAAHRLVTLAAQCRLEREEPAVAEAERERTSAPLTELEPAGRPRQERIFEEVDDGERRTSGAVYTELGTSPVAVRAPAGAVETRGLFWTRDLADLGAPLTIAEGARPLLETALRSQSAPFALRDLAAGPHQLRAAAPPGARVFIALPPDGRGTHAFASRTVFALARATPLTVRVPPGKRTLWLVVYAPGAPAPAGLSVRALFDGGHPERVVGTPLARVTDVAPSVPVPASARPPAVFLDRVGEAVGRARSTRFRFGDDLRDGPHTVTFSLEGGGNLRVYVRVLAEGSVGSTVAAPTLTRHGAWSGGEDG